MATVAARQYLESLAQEFNLSDEDKAILLKVADKEAVAKRLVDDHKRQSDYSRAMDDARKKADELAAREREWTDWYTKASARDAERERELQELKTRGGSGDGAGAGNGSGATGLTQADVQKLLQEQGTRLINVTKQMGKVASRHAAEFHEMLDVDALEKLAIDNNITVEAAYERMIEPRIKEREKVEFEAKLKQAREEGVKEGMSKQNIPDEATRGHHVFFDRKQEPKPATERERVSSFAESWRDAATQGVNK